MAERPPMIFYEEEVEETAPVSKSVLSEVPGGVTYTKKLAPEILPSKVDAPVQETRPQTRPPMIIEEGERLSVREEPLGAEKAFAKGAIEFLTFVPDVALQMFGGMFRSSYPRLTSGRTPEQLPGLRMEEEPPIPPAGRYQAGLGESPGALPYPRLISLGDVVKSGVKTLTGGIVDPYPREPRTDAEKLILEGAYFGGGATTMAIPIGVWSNWASQISMRTAQGVAARNVLSKYYSAPEAFIDAMLQYGRTYVTRPTVGRELGMGILMGVGHATPNFMDNANEQMPLNLGEGIGVVDIKPTMQMMLSLGFPILGAARSPATYLEGLGPASKKLIRKFWEKGADFTGRAFQGFHPQGRQDMLARIFKTVSTDMTWPPRDPSQRTGESTAELFLKAVDEGFFAGSTSNFTPIVRLPNGSWGPASAGLSPDFLQALREMPGGVNDLGLAALEKAIAAKPRVERSRIQRQEEIDATINRTIGEFKNRLGNADPDEAYDFLTQARTTLRESSEEQVRIKAEQALKAYEDLLPVVGREPASLVARKMVEVARKSATKTERELWSPEVLGVHNISNTKVIGNWARDVINAAERSTRETLPSEYYRLAGVKRLNEIGIGQAGKPLTKRDIPAGVRDEDGNLLADNLETIPDNGMYDLFPTEGMAPGTSPAMRPVSILDIQIYRSNLGDKMVRAYRSNRPKLGHFYSDIRTFITDDVLTEANIFGTGFVVPTTSEINEAAQLVRNGTALVSRYQREIGEMTERGASATEIRVAEDELAETTQLLNTAEQKLGRLREEAQTPVAEEDAVPLPEQLQALREARAFTTWKHDTYERSGLGELLGLKASGAEITSPQEFLSKLVITGAGSGEAVREFRAAINVPQKMVDAEGAVTWGTPIDATLTPGGNPNVIEAQILRRLVESAGGGKVTERLVHNLIRDHAEAIREVPGLAERLTNLELLQRDVADITARVTNPTDVEINAALKRNGTLADVEEARTVNLRRLEAEQDNNTAFIYLDADKEVAANAFLDLDLKTAFSRADVIMNELMKDPSKRALAGFRVGLWDALKKRSMPIDSTTKLPSGNVDLTMLARNIEKYRPYVDKFFDESQIAWLENTVAGIPYARPGVDLPVRAAREDMMAVGYGKAVQEAVHAGGRVAGQATGQHLIALNTLSSSFLGRRLAADLWSTKGRDEIIDLGEAAFRSIDAAALLTRRAMDLPDIAPPLLGKVVNREYTRALKLHQNAMDKLRTQRQAARAKYLVAYDEAIARGVSEEEAKMLGGEASAEANRAAKEEVEAKLKKIRDDGMEKGLYFASAGLGKTLNFISSRLKPRLERLAALGLIAATYPLTPGTLESDWQLGAPFTFEENRRRFEIERRALGQEAAQTSLVAPQSIPNAASSLAQQPVVSPVGGQRPVYPGASPAPVPPPGAPTQPRNITGQDLFPHDPVFGTAGFKQGGLASLKKKKKSRQMVY